MGGDREGEALTGSLGGQGARILFEFLQTGLGALCLQDQETPLGDKAPNVGYKGGKVWEFISSGLHFSSSQGNLGQGKLWG